MDIGFSEEQELLRDTARKFLDDVIYVYSATPCVRWSDPRVVP